MAVICFTVKIVLRMRYVIYLIVKNNHPLLQYHFYKNGDWKNQFRTVLLKISKLAYTCLIAMH